MRLSMGSPRLRRSSLPTDVSTKTPFVSMATILAWSALNSPRLWSFVGPTDFVTFNDGQRFALEERQPAIVCARPQARGIELAKPSFPVLKHELLPRMVNGRSEEQTSELQSLMRTPT